MSTERISNPIRSLAEGYGIHGLAWDGPALGEALRGEVLRSLIWAHSSEASEPVSTSLLMHRAERITCLLPECRGSHPGDEHERLKETLEHLGDVHDIVRVAGGGWLAAPTRLVQVSSERHLLIGGFPTGLFPGVERGLVEHRGIARWIQGRLIGAFSSMRTQSYAGWLGHPKPGFDEDLQRFDEEPLEFPERDESAAAEWSFYAPHFTTSTARSGTTGSTSAISHGKRWAKAGQLPPGGSERFLIRRVDAFTRSDYAVGAVTAQALTEISGRRILHHESRRLQYAIDQRVKCPLEMHYEQGTNGSVRLRQWCALPDGELRLLLATGTSKLANVTKTYPKDWTFRSPQEFTDARRGLEAIGIVLTSAPQLAQL